jgi:deoxycytidine triphosphate deaminase
MYGNLLNNQQILELVNSHHIRVWPEFDVDSLQLADYPLTIGAVIGIGEPTPRTVASPYSPERLATDREVFEIPPGEYRIIVVRERVELSKGLLGQFLPASSAIESGLLLTMGKLEHPFGSTGEYIRFGVFNANRKIASLERGARVAYLRVHDFRALNNAEVRLTERDEAIYSSRRIVPSDRDGHINYEKDLK